MRIAGGSIFRFSMMSSNEYMNIMVPPTDAEIISSASG